jgi:hypothetical protein
MLGGEHHGSDDAERIQRLRIDICDSLYDRKPFCWEDIRLLPALRELTLVSFDADEAVEEVMLHFRSTLAAVMRAHPGWVLPEIEVVSVHTGASWGFVRAPVVKQVLVGEDDV